MSDKWQCPVCKHNKYEIYGGMSGHESHYYCEGCTVRFYDPKKFNNESINQRASAQDQGSVADTRSECRPT